jgi:hypothetical protein
MISSIINKNKLLNIWTAFFGILLLISGFLKMLDMFRSVELSIGNMYLKIPNSNSFAYNLIVNFIGGVSMIFHSISTINFKRSILLKDEPEFINNLNNSELKEMSKVSLITGLLTMLVSFWLIIRTTVILTAFEGSITDFYPLFILVIILYGTFSFIPILLTGKNLKLNSEISAKLEKVNRTELRMKNKNKTIR